MIELTKNGVPYTDWLSASVTVSLRTLANDFSFTASAVNGFPAPKKGDEITVRVDGELRLTGTIDEISGTENDTSHTITYSGRDITGDLIDSDIDVIDDIRPSSSLTIKKLIQIIIDHLGLSVNVLDDLRPAPFNKAEDIIAPEPGRNAFDFIMSYARKRQAMVTSTGRGDILITQSQPDDSGVTLQRLQGSDSNNILRHSWQLSDSVRFNKYVRRGQLDPRALNFAGDTSASTVENQSGSAIDADIRRGRQQVKIESESYSASQLKDRATWARQLADAEGIRYSCVVRGHSNPFGEPWEVNTLVQINADTADISRKMLLDTMTFSEGNGQPTITTLEFVEQNVYTIDEAVTAQKPAGSLNDEFKF